MKNLAYLIFLLTISALIGFGFTTQPATKPQSPKIKVMMLGSHFMPHDVLRSSRQKEVVELVESLGRFSPDKILLDIPAQSVWEKQLNKDLNAYFSGNYILNRSAREQIGFRLARLLGHTKLYGVDSEQGFNLSGSISSFHVEGNHPGIDELVRLGRGVESAKQEHLNYGTISNYFAYLNNPENLSYEHGIYVRGFTGIGGFSKSSGTSVLADWYKYHMDILSNLSRISSSTDSRILIIMDSSFAPVLKELIDADPRYEWVEPSRFLNVP